MIVYHKVTTRWRCCASFSDLLLRSAILGSFRLLSSHSSQSETRSSVAAPRLFLLFSPPSGSPLQPAAQRRILGLCDGRPRRAARRSLNPFRLSSSAAENPGRRPAVCAPPPAGLQLRLPPFCWKMDGFTGSLGEYGTRRTQNRTEPAHLLVHR